MPSRRVTPWVPESELYSDHFRRRATYQNWRPKGSGDCLLIHTLSGRGAFSTAKGTTLASRGDVVLYHPGERHDYRTDPQAGKWELLWVHFTPRSHWQPWLKWPEDEQGVKVIRLRAGETRRQFTRAMREVVRLPRLHHPQALDLAANALEAALLWTHISSANARWFAVDPRIRKTLDHLALNFRAPFAMEGLAHHSGLSPSRLAHLFKQETGTSPQRFVENQRIREACALLRITRQSIAEIAAQVGYDDPFYFSKRFQRHHGRSPRQYRDEAGAPVRRTSLKWA